MKNDGSVLEKKKSSFKMLELTFSSKLDWGSYTFFLLSLLYIPIILPYAHTWNSVLTSGLMPLVVT